MKEVTKLIETLHPLERKLLPALREGITVEELISQTGLADVEVIRALQWLGNKKVLHIDKQDRHQILLGLHGKRSLEKGLPERRFLQVLEQQPLLLRDIQEEADLDTDELNISLGLLKKHNAIVLGERISLTAAGTKLIQEKIQEETFLRSLPRDMHQLTAQEKKIYDSFSKRRGILETKLHHTITVHLTELGKTLTKTKISGEFIDTLDKQTIISGSWKNKKFRRFDVEINVPARYPGKIHFVQQAIDSIKKIWIEMGFQEMDGPLVETSFWNFDALFVPQDHPAREMQDTFFVGGEGKLPDKKIVDAVKKTHENGWTTGSLGWRSAWSERIAKQLVLRTHTTSLSARTLASLKKQDLPGKFFSVAKCFRNEAVDWKHSFEFMQVEGIVVDENANFRHLLGYLKEYYHKLGYDKIRFRPSYYPYTELSVDTSYYHPEKKQWIEFGGAGMFRPEVVKPLLGFDVPVLAWGQGMDRSILSHYGLTDLRDLCKNDLKQLREMKAWM